MKPLSILIVEDDPDINNMLFELLTQNNYAPVQAFSGTEALLCLERGQFSLILLDLMLPGISGEEVLKKLRRTSSLPVIGVSAKDDPLDKINLLKNGADDYVTKPFNTGELLARIETVLRRNKQLSDELDRVLTFKDLILNQNTLSVKCNGCLLNLTKHEYLILELLMHNPEKVFTKNNIFESVWNEEFLGEDNTVNVHISNLRQKLAKANPEEKYIQTVWGIGFKMKQD